MEQPRLRILVGVLAVLLLPASGWAAVACLDTPGDLNGSGAVNVADAVCATLVVLDELAGGAGADPSCLADSRDTTDIDCDDSIVVADVQLMIGLAIGAGLPSALDADADNCADSCPLPFGGCTPIGDTLYFDGVNEANAQAKWQSMMTVTFTESVNGVTFSFDPNAHFTDDHGSDPGLGYSAHIDIPADAPPLEFDYDIEGVSMDDAAVFVFWEDDQGGFHNIDCVAQTFPSGGTYNSVTLAQEPYTCPATPVNSYVISDTIPLPTAFVPVAVHLRVFIYAVPNGDYLDVRKFGFIDTPDTCSDGATCLEVRDGPLNTGSGEYLIDPDGAGGRDPFFTYCDMTTNGGGWTLLGYSSNSAMAAAKSLSQNGNWNTYTQTGYGTPGVDSSTIFWVALADWHSLTQQYPDNVWRIIDPVNEMRMNDLDIGTEAQDYRLQYTDAVTGFDELLGGQSPGAVKGQGFTTHDMDNDTWPNNCARDNIGFNGGFWYTNCWQNSMVHADGTVRGWYVNGDPSNPAVASLGLWFREN